MAKDNQVLVRLNDPQFEAFKEFAEDRDYNHAEASREIIKSRLAGEGYLQNQHYGDPITDGGLEDQVEKNGEQIEEAGGKVAELTEQVERESRNETLNYLFMFIGLLYIAASLQYDFPSPTIGIGVIALIGIAATNYRSMVNNV